MTSVLFALVCSILGIAMGLVFTRKISAMPAGDEK